MDRKSEKESLNRENGALKDTREKEEKAEFAFDNSFQKIKSPFQQKEKELDAAMNKAEEPFNIIKAKQQQAKNAMEEAKNKAEAAKKILNAKEILHEEGKNKTNKTMSDAKSKAEKAKNNIEDAQRDFQKADELVKSLIAKLKSQA